jgi:histidinol-phosphate aminotransferase
MSYFRPEIEAMRGYVPGEQPREGEIVKLNTNENPYPASPAVAEAIREVLDRGWLAIPTRWGSRFVRRRPRCMALSPTGFSAATAATIS